MAVVTEGGSQGLDAHESIVPSRQRLSLVAWDPVAQKEAWGVDCGGKFPKLGYMRHA